MTLQTPAHCILEHCICGPGAEGNDFNINAKFSEKCFFTKEFVGKKSSYTLFSAILPLKVPNNQKVNVPCSILILTFKVLIFGFDLN